MAEDNSDWSTSANDAIKISLVTPSIGGAKTLHTFHPKMTYSIFGDSESIYGYQGLKINIRYNACDMRPGLQITYTKKAKDVEGTGPDDLKGILEPFLPKNAFEKSSAYEAAISEVSNADWRPPGELWKTIQFGGQTSEVWMGSLADPKVLQMVKRIQILVHLYIEGGSSINVDDEEALDRWTVFSLYQKKPTAPGESPYVFMGYSTVHRYFYVKAATRPKTPAEVDFSLPLPALPFSSIPARSRISQFVILPPFQGGGNGSRFYNAIFDYYLKQPQTVEITVEDPNEAFDDMRDLNDLLRLRTYPEFTALKINTKAAIQPHEGVPKDMLDRTALETIRQKLKIAPRQFARVTEMQLLSLIPANVRMVFTTEQERKLGPETKLQEYEYRLWKLWVMQRLYKHNKDSLMQMERVERIEKLDAALRAVEADYGRLLRAFDSRKHPKAGDSPNGTKNGKRSNTEDSEGESSSKKVKFS